MNRDDALQKVFTKENIDIFLNTLDNYTDELYSMKRFHKVVLTLVGETEEKVSLYKFKKFINSIKVLDRRMILDYY